MKTRTVNDLLLVLILTVAAAVALYLGINNPILRVLLGVPFVLVLPGYAIVAAAFPQPSYGALERAVYVIGISLAVAVVGGVVLNATPWGLSPRAWSVLMASITVAASILALVRRTAGDSVGTKTSVEFRPGQLVLFAFALVAVGAAFLIVRMPAPPTRVEGYTTLWIQPGKDVGPHVVRLGVSNMELARTSYELELRVNGVKVKEFTLNALDPGETWQASADLTNVEEMPKVEALLYRADAPDTVYRRVELGAVN